MPRRFNLGQRIALYLHAQGVCEECGAELQRGWHGDHLRPWIRGGQTDVINGQALCPDCNRRKGTKMAELRPWPDDPPLRAWQAEMWAAYTHHQRSDFLLVATPGAGKTIAALWIAHNLLASGRIARVVVVCPTDNLRGQWAEVANDVGISLDKKWDAKDGGETADFHGVVVTYAQLQPRSTILRLLCRRPTLYIFDEVHHAGEQNSWGDSMKEAAELGAFRLHLSGTPFRSDRKRIPFINYEDNRSRADFTYGYIDALNESVCRPVVFASYEGDLEWYSNDRVITATFADDLSEAQQAERLRTALDPYGNWLPSVLKEANDRLMDIRANEHPDAAGLVFARDTAHADAIAQKLESIIRRRPVVVTIDNPDARDDIRRFNKSTDPWIIAIKMISEGTDIKRLRVGVYATTTTSMLFFRQAVGRFLRVILRDRNEVAYMYMPKDPVLMDFARTIKREVDHALSDEDTEPRLGSTLLPTQFNLYYAIGAEAHPDEIVFDGRPIDPFYIEKARELISRIDGARLAVEVVARLLEMHDQNAPSRTQPAASPASDRPVSEQRQKQRKRVHTLVGRLAGILIRKNGGAFTDTCKAIYAQLSRTDGANANTALMEQLRARAELLEERIKEEARG